MVDFTPWTEKYRPRTLDEIIGQEEVIKALKGFVKAGNMPHLLFAGPPGCGKTTAALALAHEFFGKELKGNFLELNASDDRGIQVVRGEIKDFARSLSLVKVPFKIIFLDEADALTNDAQNALRRTMELYSGVTRFILSCNYSSRIIEPIQSRTAVLRFRPLNKEEVKKLVDRVAQGENLIIKPNAYDALYYVSEGDMRRVINVLQGASMHTKEIDEEIIYKISARARQKEVKEMIELAMKKEFLKARQMLDKLILHYGLSGDDIVFQMHKEIIEMNIDEKKKAKMLSQLGEINFRIVEGANERIQVEAYLAYLGGL